MSDALPETCEIASSKTPRDDGGRVRKNNLLILANHFRWSIAIGLPTFQLNGWEAFFLSKFLSNLEFSSVSIPPSSALGSCQATAMPSDECRIEELETAAVLFIKCSDHFSNPNFHQTPPKHSPPPEGWPTGRGGFGATANWRRSTKSLPLYPPFLHSPVRAAVCSPAAQALGLGPIPHLS